MKRSKILLAGVLALALVALAAASDGDPVAPPLPEAADAADLVETALDADEFGILVTLIEAAGLTDILRVEGPFTLFAPTDAAFEALPDGSLDALRADPEALRRVLLAHVLTVEMSSGEIAGLTTAFTAAGTDLPVRAGGSRGVLVGEAALVGAAIPGINGIIHAVDAVLLPVSPG